MAAHEETTDEARAADSESAAQAGEHTEEQAGATTPPEADALTEVPAVWLRWKGPRHYGHIPTTGSGVGGELTPAEVQAWFTPALYAQALQDGIYEVVDAGTVRDPRPAAQKEAPDAR